MLVCNRNGAVAHERRAAREHFIEQAGRGIKVTSRVDRLSPGLLGRQVLRRSNNRLGLGHCGCGVGNRPGDTEIHHFHAAVGRDHHIGWFDVAMNDSGPVAVFECRKHAEGVLDGLVDTEFLGTDQITQRPAIDILHHDKRHGDRFGDVVHHALITGVEDRHNAGMVQPRHRLRFAPETRLELRIAGQVRAEELDGHRTAQPDVTTEVNVGHTATADQFTYFVTSIEDTLLAQISPVSGG